MKKIFTIVILMIIGTLLTTGVFAQSPEKMSYQAVVRNSVDELMIDHSIGMQISILQGSEDGVEVYVERQFPQTNSNGLVSIKIGEGTIVTGNFADINWSDDIHFIKTEIDLDGGANYSITGVSQLLSVPYALHAKTAETVTGTINENDPVFTSSEAANITETDITNLGNLSGTNTGDQDISGIAENTQAIQDTASQIRADIPDVSGFLTSETDPSVPSGTQTGEMQYWNGSQWVTVSAGNEGQVLTFIGSVPTWITPVVNIQNPTTGKIWMDKNLGASYVATSSTDANAYGDLYQWGRDADGHEKRTSGTTTILSNSDTPGHGNFITVDSSPYDWRNPQNDNLWQGVSGINNPCPSGYRLPTDAELEAERLSWSSNNSAGAFASPLKLPVAGYRNLSDGSLYSVGSSGYYWSSTVDGTYSRYLDFYSSFASMYSFSRANGLSVRCLKD